MSPKTVWFTGLSGSGKTTLATLLSDSLQAQGKHTSFVDGDALRNGLCADLGFSREDRSENLRRAAWLCHHINQSGFICIAAFISPFAQDRELVRSIIGSNNFFEIYLSTPLSVCEARDVKGLYRQARSGKILNFTGVSDVYEVPQEPDMIIDTSSVDTKTAIELINNKIH
jgi:adenylyl-sulfate kinase